MALSFIPIQDATLQGMVDKINIALTPLTSEALLGVNFQALDQTRLNGRDFLSIITHNTGTAVMSAPFQAVGFEGNDPQDVAAAMAVWVAAHPGYFISPAFTIGLPAARHDRRQAGILFYCTDAANALKNWEASGGGGGTATNDHNVLTNRGMINQHPTRAITYDAATVCLNAATTILDSLPITPGLGCASSYEFFISDLADPDNGFALGRFGMACGPAGLVVGVNTIIEVVGNNSVPGCTLNCQVVGAVLQFRATVAGLAGGAKVVWRRINMTPAS